MPTSHYIQYAKAMPYSRPVFQQSNTQHARVSDNPLRFVLNYGTRSFSQQIFMSLKKSTPLRQGINYIIHGNNVSK